MSGRPLRLTRPALFAPAELERIEEAALRILEEIGIEIGHPEVAARARQHGFAEHLGRFRLPRRQVKEFLDQMRGGAWRPRRRALPQEADPHLAMGVSHYPLLVHDPERDELLPLTTERLRAATKLAAMLGDRGLIPEVPGYPADVPAPLQPLMQFRIAIEAFPKGGRWVDHKSLATLPYLMEMAETVGEPIRRIPIYVFSPLRLAGESLSAALACEPRLEGVHVGSMPAAGNTAPVRPGEAFALAAAEILGSALILRACLSCSVSWSIGLHPFDLHGLAMSFGSPEALLFELASCEVNAYLYGQAWWPAAGNIHTLAKLPGPQAAAEKMSILTTGALLGAREFWGAGALSLDEVFSPVQLLLDLELKDHVARLLRGLDTRCDLETCLAQARAGAEEGFLALDETLHRYQELYWHPRLFERRFLASWQAASSPSLGQQAWEMARQLIAAHDYQPPAEVMAELDRIYRRAARELIG